MDVSDLDRANLLRLLLAPVHAMEVDQRLLRAIWFVTNDLTKRRSLQEVAQAAAMERTYFSRHFRRTFGTPYSHWERTVRITHAAKLLRETLSPITAVGMAVGYNDITTFERNFRRCTGISPREYRCRSEESAHSSFEVSVDPVRSK